MPDMMNLDYLKLPYCELIISKVRGYNYVSSRWLAKKKTTQMAVVRQQTHRKHLLKSLIITSLAVI